jgi:hypothetical protein
MKFYFVVRLPTVNASTSKTKELPAKFTERAQAQETCDAFNRMKREDEPGFTVEERDEPGKALM